MTPDISIACLGNYENFERDPLQGDGRKVLIFCPNKQTSSRLVDQAVKVFTQNSSSFISSMEAVLSYDQISGIGH